MNHHPHPSDPLRVHQESGDDPSSTYEAAVEAVLAGLSVPRSDPTWLARARLARSLARTLDVGAGMSTEAVAQELQATLASLAPEVGTDDDSRSAYDSRSG